MTVSYTTNSHRIGSSIEAERATLRNDDEDVLEPGREFAAQESDRASIVSDTISIIPGLGYHYGRFVEWAGERIVAGLVQLDIHRRKWMIQRLVNRLDRTVEVADRSVFLQRRGEDLHRASKDLLELSS